MENFLIRFFVAAQVIFILIHIFSFKFVQLEIKRLIVLVGITAIIIFGLHLEFVKILNDEFSVKSFYSGAPATAFDHSDHYAIILYVCFLILAFVNGMIFLSILYYKCKGAKKIKFNYISNGEIQESEDVNKER